MGLLTGLWEAEELSFDMERCVAKNNHTLTSDSPKMSVNYDLFSSGYPVRDT
jgi:hypothetical protein